MMTVYDGAVVELRVIVDRVSGQHVHEHELYEHDGREHPPGRGAYGRGLDLVEPLARKRTRAPSRHGSRTRA